MTIGTWLRKLPTIQSRHLFPEVKAKIADWLIANEQKNYRQSQVKALDLLERHVRDVRAGRYHRPEDLVKEFPNEPEFK